MADQDSSTPTQQRFILVEIAREHRNEVKVIMGGVYVSFVGIMCLLVLYATVRWGGNLAGFPVARIELLESIDFKGMVASLTLSAINVPFKLAAMMIGKNAQKTQ
jgi:uncharacterized membrane protein YozB (DUF420 family)